MKAKFLATLVAAAAVAMVSAIAVRGPATQLAKSIDAPAQILVSADGMSQIDLPPGWQDVRQVDSAYHMEILEPSNQVLLTLQTLDKETVGPGYGKEFADQVRIAANQTMTNPQMSGPQTITISSGQSATQFQSQGLVKGGDIELITVSTLVETPNHYHILTAISPLVSFEHSQAELQQIIASFQEATTASQHRP